MHVNENGHVESMENNSTTKQPSASDPPVNGDDGSNGDIPTNAPDNIVTATNASARDHSNNGVVQETVDVD